ncbi:hypothetical protein C2845_PM15G03110 [Panicum miliaceum]|uniref:Uncharacterized protein n=1 Tax=Panicum miliaceum TaxID=4540 RepID=A0A3L6Q647_PANMI|nr:hypothetical protein C2845_PM15G03110 [Panicum miliaceum]
MCSVRVVRLDAETHVEEFMPTASSLCNSGVCAPPMSGAGDIMPNKMLLGGAGDIKPAVGQKFDASQVVYEFYNLYSWRTGFDISFIEEHNFALLSGCGETRQWKSHNHLDPATRHFIHNVKTNNISLRKVYVLLETMLGPTGLAPFTNQEHAM